MSPDVKEAPASATLAAQQHKTLIDQVDLTKLSIKKEFTVHRLPRVQEKF